MARCKKHVPDDIPQVVPPPAVSTQAPPPASPPAPTAAATLSHAYFAFDASALSADAKRALDEDARLLAQNPQVQVEIQGHCDERGSTAYNMALGQRRAQAVRNYLVAQGVSANRLTTVSFGEERPARSGSDEGAWSQNRRAELELLSEISGLEGTVR
jgi:peptidoglycan-associated lipoprotein